MEDKKQVIDCFEEQLKNALNNTTSDCCISINHHREIWDEILKAIQNTKQALTTKSEKEQALEIIVNKKVDMNVIVDYDCKSAKDYNNYMKLYRFDFIVLYEKEFKIVSKVAKEIRQYERR